MNPQTRPSTTNYGRQEQQTLTPDLAVIGGGLAGTFAAIAAARLGATVVLIQERPVLGGNSSSEVRVHPVGASQHGYRRDSRETGIMEEVFLEVRSRGHGHKQFNGRHYPMWDVILEEKARDEDHLTLFLNTRVIDVETAPETGNGYERRIVSLRAVQQGTEADLRIRPAAVIDATGDGFVAVQAGAPFRYGRESRAEFGESWAPEEPDDIVLGDTIMFAAVDVGRPVPFTPPSWAHHFPDEESLPFRPHTDIESGYWWLEWGGRLNTIADSDRIRQELHAAVFGVWDHIKNQCTVPGVRERAATWALDWIGQTPGKRESRRFEGDHILSERDLLDGSRRPPFDAVAFGGWPIDLHAPDGVYSPDKPCSQPPLKDIYGIPLRSLYSRTVSNLWLAGRNISQTHVAHGSTRVMKTTAVIGEASGTAAAIALRHGLTPRNVVVDRARLAEVQQQLLRQGAHVPGIANTQDDDIVRRAGASFQATSTAELRIDASRDTDPAWELAGISEFNEVRRRIEGQQVAELRSHPIDVATGQAIVLSAGRLDALSLDLENADDTAITVTLVIRAASHLRDFDGVELASITDTVAPGRHTVVFRPPVSLHVATGTPVLAVLPPAPGLRWVMSHQEPPGTQAGHWDADLGQWRWLHGTLGIAVEPPSFPFGPEQVASGIGRPDVGTNMWISDPALPLPQSLVVDFGAVEQVATIEVTFDSQLSGWIWEGAFPLIARDYTVDGCRAGEWIELVHATGNVQRRRVHRIAPQTLSGLRVTIHATHEGRTARIVELRAYGS